jgi:sensor histidine kinase YesM
MTSLSLLTGIFVIYPNINSFFWHRENVDAEYFVFFFFRYSFFCALIRFLLSVNILRADTLTFFGRLLKNFLITFAAYLIYVCISIFLSRHNDCFTGVLFFQFTVACMLCTFSGYVYAMYSYQRHKETEIEQLKIENLQSRYDALSGRINPHFFFNSLNGIAALVREEKKEETLEYIHKLSGVFRYILKSDGKGMVRLCEELDFLDALRYIFEIRYADKLKFTIDIDERKHELQIPVLSLLPLIENVVKHNVIDSENFMTVTIHLNDRNELTVSNSVHKKLEVSGSSGIGLSNLSERFKLLTNTEIRIERNRETFTVILPLLPVRKHETQY